MTDTIDRSELMPDVSDGDVIAMLTPGRYVNMPNGPRCKDDGTKLRIRYLTPLECWRLMGQPDEAFHAAKAIGTSESQLYKQAGNSIVVGCLQAIFEGMYVRRTWDGSQRTLGEWM